MNKLKL